MPRNGITVSYGNSIFNILRKKISIFERFAFLMWKTTCETEEISVSPLTFHDQRKKRETTRGLWGAVKTRIVFPRCWCFSLEDVPWAIPGVGALAGQARWTETSLAWRAAGHQGQEGCLQHKSKSWAEARRIRPKPSHDHALQSSEDSRGSHGQMASVLLSLPFPAWP